MYDYKHLFLNRVLKHTQAYITCFTDIIILHYCCNVCNQYQLQNFKTSLYVQIALLLHYNYVVCHIEITMSPLPSLESIMPTTFQSYLNVVSKSIHFD